jgi:hypothetical protein
VAVLAGNRPDLTAAQLGAYGQWLTVQLLAWSTIDPLSGRLAVSIGSSVLAVAHVAADAYLRAHRLEADAVRQAV